MTLINDNVDLIKASLITAIKKELVETYPKQFGDYKNGNVESIQKYIGNIQYVINLNFQYVCYLHLKMYLKDKMK